jgi:hypothetical protein
LRNPSALGVVHLLRSSHVVGRFLVVILLTYLGLLAVTFFIGRVMPDRPRSSRSSGTARRST